MRQAARRHTASLPPAFVGIATDDQPGMPLVFLFWAVGLPLALWAAFPTLRLRSTPD